jgi:hypothetical protein
MPSFFAVEAIFPFIDFLTIEFVFIFGTFLQLMAKLITAAAFNLIFALLSEMASLTTLVTGFLFFLV